MKKVLLINGSPHEHGCTYTALKEMINVFEENIKGHEGWSYCQIGYKFGYLPTSFLDKTKIQEAMIKTKKNMQRSMRQSYISTKLA